MFVSHICTLNTWLWHICSYSTAPRTSALSFFPTRLFVVMYIPLCRSLLRSLTFWCVYICVCLSNFKIWFGFFCFLSFFLMQKPTLPTWLTLLSLYRTSFVFLYFYADEITFEICRTHTYQNATTMKNK